MGLDQYLQDSYEDYMRFEMIECAMCDRMIEDEFVVSCPSEPDYSFCCDECCIKFKIMWEHEQEEIS